MGTNNLEVDKTEETAAEFQGSGKSTGFENVKNIIADKLHSAAEGLGEKGADQDEEIRNGKISKAGIRVVRPFSRVRSEIRL